MVRLNITAKNLVFPEKSSDKILFQMKKWIRMEAKSLPEYVDMQLLIIR